MPDAVSLLRQLEERLQSFDSDARPSATAEQRQQLVSLVLLLHKWNRVYNLTAVRDPVDMLDRHILDSLVLQRWLPLPAATSAANSLHVAGTTDTTEKTCRADSVDGMDSMDGMDGMDGMDVMDVGTGAGLPVLPLAIVRPDLQFLSVESNGKKTRFQQQAVMELGLSNVRVENRRVQDLNESAQLVMSRAFAAPADFLALVWRLCETGGAALVTLGKSDRMPDTLDARFELQELARVRVPGTDYDRHVALCRRCDG